MIKSLSESVLKGKNICQVGLIVRDIQKAVQFNAALYGVEEPDIEISDGYEKAHTMYRGNPTEAQAKLAFFDCGQVTLELIEPVGGPSTWQEFLDNKGEGIHHIAFIVENIKEQCRIFSEQLGIETIQTGDYEGGCYAYVDATEQFGTIIELLENF